MARVCTRSQMFILHIEVITKIIYCMYMFSDVHAIYMSKLCSMV